MTPASSPVLRPPRRRAKIVVAPRPVAVRRPAGYDRPFWLAYVASLLVSAAVAVLYRYADFVSVLGGTEFHLGWIVGVGMVGSLCMRMFLGSWIDRYGARPLWLGSILLFVVTCLAHLAVTSHAGVAVYLLRVSYCIAVAGIGGAAATFVSVRTPDERLAEMVGMLGTGGFMGVVAGTLLGDLLLGSIAVSSAHVAQMFLCAALLALVSLPFAWAATRGERVSRDIREGRTHKEDSLALLLWRYSPRMILVIGVTMGMALGLPSTFLRTYASELGIPRIGLFFFAYCIAAVVIRVPTRRWSERFGPRRIILAGMAGMAASVAIFPWVRSEWQLALPAIGFGCSHGILWPAVVAAGSVTFPPQNRGLATVLLLAAWDVGLLIASPSIGAVLRYSQAFGLPPYPTMFFSMAALVALVTVWYAFFGSGDEAGQS